MNFCSVALPAVQITYGVTDAVQPGRVFSQPHVVANRIMVEGLVEHGLLEGEVDTFVESEAYKVFCVHKTSHWIGLDVHDIGDYQVNNGGIQSDGCL